MPTEYETVVDATTLISSLVPVLIHLTMVAAQTFVAGFFVIQGAALLAKPDERSTLFDRFGALRSEGVSARVIGVIQLVSGALMLTPIALRWPWLVSMSATVLALGTLVVFGPGASQLGRPMRRLAAIAAVLTLLFMCWERDDPNAQAFRILFKANEWRAHELEWQLTNDVRSPKVGDLAPDFELEDPSGRNSIKLSMFVGKRPVALVFGSYT
jgi:hypothetical protein